MTSAFAKRRIKITELKLGDHVPCMSGRETFNARVCAISPKENATRFHIELSAPGFSGGYTYDSDEFIDIVEVPQFSSGQPPHFRAATPAEVENFRGLVNPAISGHGGSGEVIDLIHRRARACQIFEKQMPRLLALLDAIKEGHWIFVEQKDAEEMHFIFSEVTAALKE